MIIGLVGKPSAGKSTFFKAATLADVEIANYPFTTINKNEGVGYVRVECVDKEFNVKCNPREGFCTNNTRYVPVRMIDVAGLVPGAHEGKGRGNQFLDDLRQADVLIHVIDVSGSINENGEPVDTGSYDPSNDIKFLELEIDKWYASILKKGWEKFARQVQQEHQQIAKSLSNQLSGLNVNEDMVKDSIRKLNLSTIITEWGDEDLYNMGVELRKKTKPMIIACNKIDILGAAENFERLKKEFPDHLLVACSSEVELALREASKSKIIDYNPGDSSFTIEDDSKLNEKQKNAMGFMQEFLTKNNTTGIQDVLDKAVFKLLEYITIFPGGTKKLEDQYGNVLPDCFLMPKGTTPLQFAFKLHTDIGNNFIKAIDVRKKTPIAKDEPLGNRSVIEIAVKK